MKLLNPYPIIGLLAAALAAGCQEEESFPLSPAGPDGVGKGAAALSMADPCADFPDSDLVVKEMLDAVNTERAKHRLRPLKIDFTLMLIADFYACRLVEGRFFSHSDPVDGSHVDTRAEDFGYAFDKVGENLAARQPTVARAMEELMASPRHRDVILDPAFTEIGIAIKHGGEHGVYWVQEFGRPITAGGPPTSTRSAAKKPTPPVHPPDTTSRPTPVL
ncbi:MAG: CAP domain-containing protein [Phycisphaerae bacterium]